MQFNNMKLINMLPRKFWVRINNLLNCPEVKSTHKGDLQDNPEIRKTLVDLIFFPETLN
jgi:hypothetical protein